MRKTRTHVSHKNGNAVKLQIITKQKHANKLINKFQVTHFYTNKKKKKKKTPDMPVINMFKIC